MPRHRNVCSTITAPVSEDGRRRNQRVAELVPAHYLTRGEPLGLRHPDVVARVRLDHRRPVVAGDHCVGADQQRERRQHEVARNVAETPEEGQPAIPR
jgi:hypothetical protein